jgi:Periplasmic protein involved in polysaccharide export
MSSCITNRDTVLLQSKGDVARYIGAKDSAYRLQPNDRIVYNVFSTDAEAAKLLTGVIPQTGMGSQVQGSAGGYRIYPDGKVRLPFMGELSVVNLTCEQAEVALRNKVRESLPDAEVRLALVSNYYYIIGSGRFEIDKDRLSIFQALSSYPGKDKMSDYKHVRLLRRLADGTYQIKTLDLRSASLINSGYYYVNPNDVFYFPTNNKAFYNITSFSGFLNFVMVPVSFLLLVLNLN